MMMNPNKGNSTLNTLMTMIDNAVSRVFTALPVTVLSVDKGKRLVDIMPMVSMLDNEGQAVDHAQISNIPYIRHQAGDYGIIIDPKVGDKGLVVFASRDISNVVANRDKHIPASMRKHSISDAIYMGSLLNEEPRTWLEITDGKLEMAIAPKNDKRNPTTFLSIEDQDVQLVLTSGAGTSVKVKSGQIDVHSAKVNIVGDVNIQGNLTVVGENHSITAMAGNTLTGQKNTIIGNTNITGNTGISGQTVIAGDANIAGISFKGHVHGNGDKGSDTTSPK